MYLTMFHRFSRSTFSVFCRLPRACTLYQSTHFSPFWLSFFFKSSSPSCYQASASLPPQHLLLSCIPFPLHTWLSFSQSCKLLDTVTKVLLQRLFWQWQSIWHWLCLSHTQRHSSLTCTLCPFLLLIRRKLSVPVFLFLVFGSLDVRPLHLLPLSLCQSSATAQRHEGLGQLSTSWNYDMDLSARGDIRNKRSAHGDIRNKRSAGQETLVQYGSMLHIPPTDFS